MEYALGLEPTANNVSDLPAYQIINDVFALSYRKYRSDVSYLVEASTDTETWSSIGVNQGSGPFPIAWKSIGTAPQMFLRLRVTGP